MQEENKSNIPWWQPGTQLFLKLSVWIAGPAIAGVFIGKYLDQKYNTQPWLLVSCAVVAFTVSMGMLMRIGLREMRKAEVENAKIKNQNGK